MKVNTSVVLEFDRWEGKCNLNFDVGKISKFIPKFYEVCLTEFKKFVTKLICHKITSNERGDTKSTNMEQCVHKTT